MMYTGSNILPIAKWLHPFLLSVCIVLFVRRFLKYTHTKQSFRSDDQQQMSDLAQRSILGQLLPEAMVCFLDNYGMCSVVYSYTTFISYSCWQVLRDIFGRVWYPWGHLEQRDEVGVTFHTAALLSHTPSHRRMMIEKIAGHIADFTPRLLSNTKSLYQYCAIPLINYPQLENELFCNIYYLRHLCDTQRFPDWPIKEPVSYSIV